MTEAERLATRVSAWAMDLDEGDRITGASHDMREAAALIRSQAEELERLREFVRSLRDHKNPDLWFLEEPARAALGER